MGVAFLGLTVHQVMSMKLVDYLGALKIKTRLNNSKLEYQFAMNKLVAEVIRKSTDLIIRVQVDKKHQHKININKLMPFTWDGDNKKEQTT